MYESQQLCDLYKLVGHQIQIGIWRGFFAEEGKPENVRNPLQQGRMLHLHPFKHFVCPFC